MRKTYIDVLKGIGIFYVVLGHITNIGELREYIWNFHMPLFFAISGFLYNADKYPGFKGFFKSRVKSIYIPYVLFFLITFLYWVVIERKFRGGEYSILHQFLGLFYGTVEGNHMYFNCALWFLPCLFSVELMFYFVSKINNNIGIFALLVLSFAIGTLLVQNDLKVLPLGLHTAFFAIIFYGIGYISKNLEPGFINLSITLKIILLIGSLFVQIWILKTKHFISIDKATINYIAIALIGIVFYMTLSLLIKKSRILEYLGKNSLIILGFHEPLYRALIGAISKILNINVDILRTNAIYCILIALICLLVIVPVIYLYNNFVRKTINRLI